MSGNIGKTWKLCKLFRLKFYSFFLVHLSKWVCENVETWLLLIIHRKSVWNTQAKKKTRINSKTAKTHAHTHTEVSKRILTFIVVISNIILGRVYLWICEWNAYAYREGWKKSTYQIDMLWKTSVFSFVICARKFCVFFLQNKRPTRWRTSIRIEVTNTIFSTLWSFYLRVFPKLVNMHWLQIMCIVFQKLTRPDLQPILLYINVQCVLFLFSTMIRLICYCLSSSINLTAMCVQIDDEWQWQIGIALPRHTLKCARNIMVEKYMPHNKSMRKSKMEMRPEDKNGFK